MTCADCGHADDKHPKGIAARLVYCQGAESSAEWCRCPQFRAGLESSSQADTSQAGDRECQHPDWSFDRTLCGGCDSMPDVCVECGWHACRPRRWAALCAGQKGYEGEPDCGECWGCLR